MQHAMWNMLWLSYKYSYIYQLKWLLMKQLGGTQEYIW